MTAACIAREACVAPKLCGAPVETELEMSTYPRVKDSPHRVLVYRVEAQLIEVAGDFLSDALAEEGAVVMIATAAHLRALDEWVEICAADVETTVAELRYHRLAIEDLAASLDRDGTPAGAF